jgi:hypothetical protein
MAKKLLSESQVSSFMKLANIDKDKIKNFTKLLKEESSGMGGTGGMEMEEDEPDSDMPEMDMESEEEASDMDMEPEAPETEVETDVTQLKDVLRDLLNELIPSAVEQAMAGSGSTELTVPDDMGGEEEEMDFSDEMTSDSGEDEVDMEDEEEVEEEEEEELQEAKKKKAVKKARNLEGGDAKKMKESLAFNNVDLVTDDEIVNEVLRRVIRKIV